MAGRKSGLPGAAMEDGIDVYKRQALRRLRVRLVGFFVRIWRL